jgi:hypothetical protein
MKKYILLAILAVGMFTANAQTATPRYGTSKNQDATYRPLSLGYAAITDGTGNDSVTIAPTRYWTNYKVTLTDSISFANPTTTSSYFGDVLVLIASGTSGNKLKFTTAATKFKTAGTATLSTGGRTIITFVFDGANWVESSRVTQ